MLRRLVKLLVWLVVFVVLAAGVLAAIGMALPRDHEASRAAVIPAPIAVVYETLNTPAAYPEWRSDVERVEILDGDRFREFGANGPMVLRIADRQAPSRLEVTVDDPDQPFSGTWTIALEEIASDRTRVRITERGSVPNPLFRAIARAMQLPTDSIDRYLKSLGRRYGTDVTIED